MRTLKSTMDMSWRTIHRLKLKDVPEHMWFNILYEHSVCAGINLIDMYKHILDNYTIPGVLFDDLTSAVGRLKHFYGEK